MVLVGLIFVLARAVPASVRPGTDGATASHCSGLKPVVATCGREGPGPAGACASLVGWHGWVRRCWSGAVQGSQAGVRQDGRWRGPTRQAAEQGEEVSGDRGRAGHRGLCWRWWRAEHGRRPVAQEVSQLAPCVTDRRVRAIPRCEMKRRLCAARSSRAKRSSLRAGPSRLHAPASLRRTGLQV